jgi:hypothetical protein
MEFKNFEGIQRNEENEHGIINLLPKKLRSSQKEMERRLFR